MATFSGQCDSCLRPIMRETDGCSTGYASDSKLGLRFCFVCCADHDKAHMRSRGRNTLYLTEDDSGHFTITNWPGSLVFHPSYVKRSTSYGFGRAFPRYDAWFTFEGRKWHAVNKGDMQIARCRQLKA